MNWSTVKSCGLKLKSIDTLSRWSNGTNADKLLRRVFRRMVKTWETTVSKLSIVVMINRNVDAGLDK